MKKIIIIIFFLITVLNTDIVKAVEKEEIIKAQEEELGISGFVTNSQKYTDEAFEDINIKDIYKDALSGKINKKGILGGILKIFGGETLKTIKNLGYILIIIVIHSIIKSISEGMGNNEIGEITYYVQYILIVTLIMTNFSETIVLIKNTINSLVGFINSLLPILLALMITTRQFSKCLSCTANTFINYYIYRKLYNKCAFATYINRDSPWNSFKNI